MTTPHPITDEERAQAAMEGWQAEERFTAHRNARRRRQALEFGRRRAEGHGVHAAMALALQAGTATGVHARPRSLPSGPAPDMRTVALGLVLLVPSAIGLGIALGGYAGISAAVHLWNRIRRVR